MICLAGHYIVEEPNGVSRRSPLRATRVQKLPGDHDRSEVHRYGRDAGGEEMNERKWVIMVYLAADDTLANFAIESLKQLKQTATNEVVVAAQFDPDGLSSEHQVRRYVFDKTTRHKPLLDDNQCWENSDHRSLNMAEPDTLTSFINWVYRKHKAENYCLILWGHGPELLFELPARSDRQILPSGAATYFTPLQLKQALQATDAIEKEKLRVIAIDACSMSMCEIAYELQGEAEFLVASQEEVPDPSFPYNTLVGLFTRDEPVKKLCQDGVVDYVKAYQEYFYSESTGTHPVTLAAIELKQMQALKGPLSALATTLMSADNKTAKAIHSARAESQGYVGGLYVDLHDFCDNLGKREPKLKGVCDNVSAAIDAAIAARAGIVDGLAVEVVNVAAQPDGAVNRQVMRVNGELVGEVMNVGVGPSAVNRQVMRVNREPVKSGDTELLSHGLSIYFPYLKDGKEKDYIEQDLVKGIPRMVDKDSEMLAGFKALNALSIRIRHGVRRQMIKDIETYYRDTHFGFAQDTNWYQFIQQGWSRILAQKEPANLDTRYLAQQCVKNLLTIIQDSGGNGKPIVETFAEATA